MTTIKKEAFYILHVTHLIEEIGESGREREGRGVEMFSCRNCLVLSHRRDCTIDYNYLKLLSRGAGNHGDLFSPSHRTLRSRSSLATTSFRSRPFAHSQPPNRFLCEEKIRKACGGGSYKKPARLVSNAAEVFVETFP